MQLAAFAGAQRMRRVKSARGGTRSVQEAELARVALTRRRAKRAAMRSGGRTRPIFSQLAEKK